MAGEPPKPPKPGDIPTPTGQAAAKRKSEKARVRLDVLLVERGLCESREQARRLIMAGEVSVASETIDKPGHLVPAEAHIVVRTPPRYVSRGGLKLEAALRDFALDVTGFVAVDVGASTGGFTDCLLQHGAAHVFAVDVGYGQLAWSLRTDSRVTPIERTNIRHLPALPNGALADLAVVDASFISLVLVLPPTLRLIKPKATVIALVKPQFEAGRDHVGKGGVVRDEAIHRRVLQEIASLAATLDLAVAGLTVSPAPGPAGNIEFLIWLRHATATSEQASDSELTSASEQAGAIDLTSAIEAVLAAARRLRDEGPRH